jgi:hypothetical protein
MKVITEAKHNSVTHSAAQQRRAALTYFVNYLDVLVVEPSVPGSSRDAYPVRSEG